LFYAVMYFVVCRLCWHFQSFGSV